MYFKARPTYPIMKNNEMVIIGTWLLVDGIGSIFVGTKSTTTGAENYVRLLRAGIGGYLILQYGL